MVLQELCRNGVVHFEHSNGSDNGEAENSCLKTWVENVT